MCRQYLVEMLRIFLKNIILDSQSINIRWNHQQIIHLLSRAQISSKQISINLTSISDTNYVSNEVVDAWLSKQSPTAKDAATTALFMLSRSEIWVR